MKESAFESENVNSSRGIALRTPKDLKRLDESSLCDIQRGMDIRANNALFFLLPTASEGIFMISSDLRLLIVLFFAVLSTSPCARGSESVTPLGPTRIRLSSEDSSNGDILHLLQQDAHRIETVQIDDGEVKSLGAADLSDSPHDFILNSSETFAYAACGSTEGEVIEVDMETFQATRTFSVGHTPDSLAISLDDKTLYVGNRFDGTVSVLDLNEEKEVRTFNAGREPFVCGLGADNKTLVVASRSPETPANRFFTCLTVRLFDVETGESSKLQLPNGSISLASGCLSPDRKYAYLTHVLANYELVPSQVFGGWINMNAMTIIDLTQGEVLNTIGLDHLQRGAGNPWGVSCSPGGRYLIVAHAGTGEVSLIDRFSLHMKLADGAIASRVMSGSPNDPGILTDIRRRIRTPLEGVRYAVISDDSIFAAGYYSDALVQIPYGDWLMSTPMVAETLRYAGQRQSREYFPYAISFDCELMRLGPEPQPDVRRRGEMLFHDATVCLQHWQSCASCHPEARSDGLNWDLMNDGVGNPKNTKSLLLAHRTPPSMATGVRASAEIAVRSGIEHILFSHLSADDVDAIDVYLQSLEPVPSPRLVGGKLSESALRGERLFESPRTGCATCHPAPLYTDMQMHDVDNRSGWEYSEEFDTPTLVEVWRTGPYLHDGSFTNIRDLLIEGGHGNASGRLDRFLEQDWDDLIEFVMSL
jgi:YVTN family beta-propeller protein